MPKHQDTDNKPILIFFNSSFCYFNCIPGLTLSLIFESFDGGRDSIERLTQGLKIAAEESPEKSLIVSIISIIYCRPDLASLVGKTHSRSLNYTYLNRTV